jgi:hypothetical protein
MSELRLILSELDSRAHPTAVRKEQNQLAPFVVTVRMKR